MNNVACVFQPFATGTISAVKQNNSKEATVFLGEYSGMASGEIKADPKVVQYTGKDANGSGRQSQTMQNNSIVCTWFPGVGGSNRITPPNVVVGERVLVYRWGDQDKYYWTTTGLDDGLRRLETVIIGLSGSPETGENVTPDINSMYFMEWSSHKKHLMFTNSKANGEKIRFTAKVDFGAGTFAIGDDANNSFAIDFMQRIMQMVNGDKSYIRIDKKNIMLGCTENMLIQALKAIKIATKNLTIEAENVVYKAKSSNWTSTGGFDITGDIRHKGDIDSTGHAVFQGGALIGGIEFGTHVHPGVKSGGDKSDVPV